MTTLQRTFSYNPASGLYGDSARMFLGDTDSRAFDLSDEEIESFLLLVGASPTGTIRAALLYRAVQLAATSLMSRFAGSTSYSVTTRGSISMQASDKFLHYQQLAAEMKALVATAGVIPYAGGISIADKQTQEQDPDRVRPFFARDQDVHPGAQLDDWSLADVESPITDSLL